MEVKLTVNNKQSNNQFTYNCEDTTELLYIANRLNEMCIPYSIDEDLSNIHSESYNKQKYEESFNKILKKLNIDDDKAIIFTIIKSMVCTNKRIPSSFLVKSTTGDQKNVKVYVGKDKYCGSVSLPIPKFDYFVLIDKYKTKIIIIDRLTLSLAKVFTSKIDGTKFIGEIALKDIKIYPKNF